MRRFRHVHRSTFLALVAATIFLPSTAQALAPNQLFGFGDQNAAGIGSATKDIYADPLMRAMKPKITRYVAQFDVARTPSEARDKVDAWYSVSLKNKIQMTVAFGALSRTKPISSSDYRTALKAFRARYPSVTEWAPMNEANHRTQPTYRKPELAASYTRIARSVCKKCKLVQLTLVTGFENDREYARRFLKKLPNSERRRMIWGLHTYSDSNRNTSTRLTRFLNEFRFGQVWLTESASWAQFAPPTWPFSPKRQASRTALVFRQAIAAKRRVKRLYWFEWDGSEDRDLRWDSGLLDGNGKARPAYKIAKRERFRTKLTKPQLRLSGLAGLEKAANRR